MEFSDEEVLRFRLKHKYFFIGMLDQEEVCNTALLYDSSSELCAGKGFAHLGAGCICFLFSIL